jgi:hypothetical protein
LGALFDIRQAGMESKRRLGRRTFAWRTKSLKTHEPSSVDGDEIDAIAIDRADLPLYASIEQHVLAHRANFIELLSETSFYAAVEAMLRFWHDLEPVYADNAVLRRLKPLVVRGRQDVEVSVYLLECGICAPALDATRDLMEIEFLVRHFVLEPSAIEHWLVANEKVRKDKFGANTLRQAEAKRRRMDVKDLHDSTDYKGHSQALHVSLSPIVPRGILENIGNIRDFKS